MNTILKWSGVVALVILAIIGVMKMTGTKAVFGSTACSGITCLSGGLRLVSDTGGDFESDVAAIFSSTLRLGTNGTSFSRIMASSTALIGPNFIVNATSTMTTDIAIPGVQPGDIVFASFATSTASALGWWIEGAIASSTSGFATVRVVNGTGVDAAIPAALASSTNSITRPGVSYIVMH